MEQYPDLQEDLSLEDTNESLNQLKLASLDDKNWPPDEVPVFPKSGEHFHFWYWLWEGAIPHFSRGCIFCNTDLRLLRSSRRVCLLSLF